MWIKFKATSHFAVKIYVGGVNVVSGEPAVETAATKLRRQTSILQHKSLQDYVVLPKQPWLDGIATSGGMVKQFVAMPMGDGYSVEAQVTGEEVTGGLQFEITPAVLPTAPPDGNCQIFVKCITGKTITVDINLGRTVEYLQGVIEDKEGIPPDQQRLIYAGCQMADNSCLSDYNVMPVSETSATCL